MDADIRRLEREALDGAATDVTRLALARARTGAGILLADALARWVVVRQRAPRTIEGYRYAFVRLAERGIVSTEDCTPQKIGEYIAWRSASCSPARARHDVTALCSVLDLLERSDEFSAETLRRLRRSKPMVPGRRRWSAICLERSEYNELLAAADGVHPRTRFMVAVGTLSGARAGELCRLRWEDVRLPSREVAIPWLPELGQHGRCKTGERMVPMCSELAQAFETVPEGDRTGFLFPIERWKRKNLFATVKVLRRELTRARFAASMPHVTFHVLRHTRAAWWIRAGVSLEKVSAWLGNSPEVVAKYYASFRPGYDPDCERSG